jgi:hypothetical protein
LLDDTHFLIDKTRDPSTVESYNEDSNVPSLIPTINESPSLLRKTVTIAQEGANFLRKINFSVMREYFPTKGLTNIDETVTHPPK